MENRKTDVHLIPTTNQMSRNLPEFIARLINTRVARPVIVVKGASTESLYLKWGIDVVDLIRLIHRPDLSEKIKLEMKKDDKDILINRCVFKFLTVGEYKTALRGDPNDFLSSKLKEYPLSKYSENQPVDGSVTDGFVGYDHYMSIFTGGFSLPAQPTSSLWDLPAAVLFISTTEDEGVWDQARNCSSLVSVSRDLDNAVDLRNVPFYGLIIHSDRFGEKAKGVYEGLMKKPQLRHVEIVKLQLEPTGDNPNGATQYNDFDPKWGVNIMRTYGPYIYKSEHYKDIERRAHGYRPQEGDKQQAGVVGDHGKLTVLREDVRRIVNFLNTFSVGVVSTAVEVLRLQELVDRVLKSKLQRVFGGGQKRTEEDSKILLEAMCSFHQWKTAIQIAKKSNLKKTENMNNKELLGLCQFKKFVKCDSATKASKLLEKARDNFLLARQVQDVRGPGRVIRAALLSIACEYIKYDVRVPFTHEDVEHAADSMALKISKTEMTERRSDVVLAITRIPFTDQLDVTTIFIEAGANILNINMMSRESLFYYFCSAERYRALNHYGLALRNYDAITSIVRATDGIMSHERVLSEIGTIKGMLISQIRKEQGTLMLYDTITQNTTSFDVLDQLKTYVSIVKANNNNNNTNTPKPAQTPPTPSTPSTPSPLPLPETLALPRIQGDSVLVMFSSYMSNQEDFGEKIPSVVSAPYGVDGPTAISSMSNTGATGEQGDGGSGSGRRFMSSKEKERAEEAIKNRDKVLAQRFRDFYTSVKVSRTTPPAGTKASLDVFGVPDVSEPVGNKQTQNTAKDRLTLGLVGMDSIRTVGLSALVDILKAYDGADVTDVFDIEKYIAGVAECSIIKRKGKERYERDTTSTPLAFTRLLKEAKLLTVNTAMVGQETTVFVPFTNPSLKDISLNNLVVVFEDNADRGQSLINTLFHDPQVRSIPANITLKAKSTGFFTVRCCFNDVGVFHYVRTEFVDTFLNSHVAVVPEPIPQDKQFDVTVTNAIPQVEFSVSVDNTPKGTKCVGISKYKLLIRNTTATPIYRLNIASDAASIIAIKLSESEEGDTTTITSSNSNEDTNTNTRDNFVLSSVYTRSPELINYNYNNEPYLPSMLSEDVWALRKTNKCDGDENKDGDKDGERQGDNERSLSLGPNETVSLSVTIFETWASSSNTTNNIDFCASWASCPTSQHLRFRPFQIRTEPSGLCATGEGKGVEIMKGFDDNPESMSFDFGTRLERALGGFASIAVETLNNFSFVSFLHNETYKMKVSGNVEVERAGGDDRWGVSRVGGEEESEHSFIVDSTVRLIKSAIRRNVTNAELRPIISGFSSVGDGAVFVATEFKNDDRELRREIQGEYNMMLRKTAFALEASLSCDLLVRVAFANGHVYIPLIRVPTQFIDQRVIASISVSDECEVGRADSITLIRNKKYPANVKGTLRIKSVNPAFIRVRYSLNQDRKNGETTSAYWQGLTGGQFVLEPFGEKEIPLELVFVAPGSFDLGSIALLTSPCLKRFGDYFQMSVNKEDMSRATVPGTGARSLFDSLPPGSKVLFEGPKDNVGGTNSADIKNYVFPEQLVFMCK